MRQEIEKLKNAGYKMALLDIKLKVLDRYLENASRPSVAEEDRAIINILDDEIAKIEGAT